MFSLKHLVKIRALASNKIAIDSFRNHHSLTRSSGAFSLNSANEYKKLLSVTFRTAFSNSEKKQELRESLENKDELSSLLHVRKIPDDSLSYTMTPELEEQICGDNIGKKFILKNALLHITNLESLKFRMPLPPTLTLEQWRQLVTLNDTRTRFHFLDSLLYGTMTYEDCLELEERISKPLEISEDRINQICGDDEEKRDKIKLFLWHHEEKRQNGDEVPYEIEDKDLINITKTHNRNATKNYIVHLMKKQIMKMQRLRQRRYAHHKTQPSIERKLAEIEECNHIYYGLGENTILMRLPDQHMKRHFDWCGWREHIYGQPLVIDFSYLSNIKSLKHRKSMMKMEAAQAALFNKQAKTPFALWFTGVDDETHQRLRELLFIEESGANFPVEITSKHQLELFPKEQLVYLSPDSKNDLKKFSGDDVYVIGGLVDRGPERRPMTLSSAKRDGIRHARFPMKQVIGLKAELNVETCVGIMTDYKYSQDWFYSFRWVPSRYFHNRIIAGSPHMEHRLAYRAHKFLSPTQHLSDEITKRNRNLSPRQYRDYYKRIMKAKDFHEMQEITKELQY